MPARLFARRPRRRTRERALAATLRSLDSVLAEPIEDCLLRDADGAPCMEARSAARPRGRAAACPAATSSTATWRGRSPRTTTRSARWGVETDDPRVLLCGAGARRGGGVSGIPGRNAAMAVLHG